MLTHGLKITVDKLANVLYNALTLTQRRNEMQTILQTAAATAALCNLTGNEDDYEDRANDIVRTVTHCTLANDSAEFTKLRSDFDYYLEQQLNIA